MRLFVACDDLNCGGSAFSYSSSGSFGTGRVLAKVGCPQASFLTTVTKCQSTPTERAAKGLSMPRDGAGYAGT